MTETNDLKAVQYYIGALTGSRCDLNDVRKGFEDLRSGLKGYASLVKARPDLVAKQMIDHWGLDTDTEQYRGAVKRHQIYFTWPPQHN